MEKKPKFMKETPEFILITPEKAEEMLSKNDHNRRLNPIAVEKIAVQMKQGKWRDTGTPIQIYTDGHMADGQHRLAAVIMSGCSFFMLVVKDVPLNAALAIDSNKPRSVTDRARIGTHDTWYDNRKSAVLRFLYLMKKRSEVYTAEYIVDTIENNDDAKERISFACEKIGPKRGIGSAPFIAAVATAYGYEENDRLKDFCKIVCSGVCYGSMDRAAILIRDYSVGSNPRIHSSFNERRKFFFMAQRAIQAFCDYREISKLLLPKEPLYPIFI